MRVLDAEEVFLGSYLPDTVLLQQHCSYTASADPCFEQSAETADPKGWLLTGVKGRGQLRRAYFGRLWLGGFGRRSWLGGWIGPEVKYVSAPSPKRNVERFVRVVACVWRTSR